MTDLQGKFSALETAMTGKFNTVIDLLTDIKTALTTSSGSIEAAPIVAAIEALRGAGPENTIKSLNQSIWNVAGPAPGISLTDLHTLLTANHAALGVYLAAIGADTDATATALGIPTGDATTTALGVLYSLQYALTTNAPNAANLFGAVRAINDAVGGVPNNSLELATVRGLLNALRSAVNATNTIMSPAELCSSPFSSGGIIRLTLPGFITPASVATWDDTPPAGLTVSDGMDVNASDWSQFSIFVQTSSSLFGTDPAGGSRYQANKWRVFAGSGVKRFYVDGDNRIAVYICPVGSFIGGQAPEGDATSSAGSTLAGGRRYVVWGNLEGITEGNGGVELTPASSWAGYEVYIQTNAPDATLHDITEPAQTIGALAVNQWHALGGNHTLAFSVDDAYLVKGYIRTTATHEDLISSLSTDSNGTQSFTFQSVTWPASYNDRTGNVGFMFTASEPVWTKLLTGRTITLLAGSRAELRYNPQGAESILITTLTPANPSVIVPEIPANAWYRVTDPSQQNGPSFTIRVDPKVQ